MDTTQRVQAFLERAKKIKSETTISVRPKQPSPVRAVLPKPVPPQINEVPKVIPPKPVKKPPQKPTLPVSPPKKPQRRISSRQNSYSPQRSLPSPKRAIQSPARTVVKPKITNVEDGRELDKATIQQLDKLVHNLMEYRHEFEAQQQTYQSKEHQIINQFQQTLYQQKGKIDHNQSIEDSELQVLLREFKQKAEQILDLVRKEAVVMDKKLFALQQENAELEKLQSVMPEMYDVSREDDAANCEILEALQQFDQSQDHQYILKPLCKKLILELIRKNQLIEYTSKEIADRELSIASLENALVEKSGETIVQ